MANIIGTLLCPQFQYLVSTSEMKADGSLKQVVMAKSKGEWNLKCSKDPSLSQRLTAVVKQNCFAVTETELNKIEGALDFVTNNGQFVHSDGIYIIKMYEMPNSEIKPEYVEGRIDNYILSLRDITNKQGKTSKVWNIVDSVANANFKALPQEAQKQVANQLATNFCNQFGISSVMNGATLVDMKALGSYKKEEPVIETTATPVAPKFLVKNKETGKEQQMSLKQIARLSKDKYEIFDKDGVQIDPTQLPF